MAKATYLLRKAGELVKERRYQDAVEVYLQATETDSSDARAWFGLGVCLYKVDNLDVARIALERAQKMGYPRAEEALARVEQAEKRRAAEGKGAKATVAPTEARRRARRKPAPAGEPPRPASRPEDQKLDLGRYLRIMLIENIETDREAIAEAIEGNLRGVEVKAADYGVTTSDTMSGTVRYDVAILDWDTSPDAAAGLIQILKIKRPALLVICLTEQWDPETAVEILEAGADYHLVKEPHFASAVPLILAQWARRDRAVELQLEKRTGSDAETAWPDALNALDRPLMLVDADLTLVRANSAAARALKKREEDLQGVFYSTVLHGSDDPPESCPVLKVLEGADTASGDIDVEPAGNTLSVRVWPVRNAAGQTTRAIVLAGAGGGDGAGASADAAAGLGTGLEAGLEQLECGFVAVDAEGRVTWANGLACGLLGRGRSDLVGQGYLEAVNADMRSALTDGDEFFGVLRAAHESGQALEAVGITVGSEELTYWSTPVAGGSPLVARVEHFYQAGAAAAGAPVPEGEGLLAGLAAAIPELVFTAEPGGRFTWCNPGAAETVGYGEKQLLGMALADLVVEEEREKLDELLARALDGGRQVQRAELIMARPGGARFWGELSLSAGNDEAGAATVLQGCLCDVTERRMARAIREIVSGDRLL